MLFPQSFIRGPKYQYCLRLQVEVTKIQIFLSIKTHIERYKRLQLTYLNHELCFTFVLSSISAFIIILKNHVDIKHQFSVIIRSTTLWKPLSNQNHCKGSQNIDQYDNSQIPQNFVLGWSVDNTTTDVTHTGFLLRFLFLDKNFLILITMGISVRVQKC
jgi:hypothetical protein